LRIFYIGFFVLGLASVSFGEGVQPPVEKTNAAWSLQITDGRHLTLPQAQSVMNALFDSNNEIVKSLNLSAKDAATVINQFDLFAHLLGDADVKMALLKLRKLEGVPSLTSDNIFAQLTAYLVALYKIELTLDISTEAVNPIQEALTGKLLEQIAEFVEKVLPGDERGRSKTDSKRLRSKFIENIVMKKAQGIDMDISVGALREEIFKSLRNSMMAYREVAHNALGIRPLKALSSKLTAKIDGILNVDLNDRYRYQDDHQAFSENLEKHGLSPRTDGNPKISGIRSFGIWVGAAAIAEAAFIFFVPESVGSMIPEIGLGAAGLVGSVFRGALRSEDVQNQMDAKKREAENKLYEQFTEEYRQEFVEKLLENTKISCSDAMDLP
jgi:hypothetical protein